MSETTEGERASIMGEHKLHGKDIILRLVQDADHLDQIERQVRELADELERDAYAAVPEDYAKRGMHEKYLRGDNDAAGLHDASQRLCALINASER